MCQLGACLNHSKPAIFPGPPAPQEKLFRYIFMHLNSIYVIFVRFEAQIRLQYALVSWRDATYIGACSQNLMLIPALRWFQEVQLVLIYVLYHLK